MAKAEIKCECNTVVGHLNSLKPHYINRVVCGCQGCRSFPKYMGKSHLLDKHDGTDIVQTSCKQLSIARGKESIAAIQQTPSGVVRFYCKECKTPLFNAMKTPKMPMIGILRKCIEIDDAMLGEVKARVMHKDKSANSSVFKTAAAMFRVTRLIFSWWVAKDFQKSPLFTTNDGGYPVLFCRLDQWDKETYLANRS